MFHYKSMVSSSYNHCHVEGAIGGLQISGKSIRSLIWSYIITKAWSFDHKINGVCYRGLQKCAKFGCSGDTFWQRLVTFDLKLYHYKSMVSWSYNHCHVYQWSVLLGVFRNVPNLGAMVTLFDSENSWSVDHIIIAMSINGVCYKGSSEMCQIWVQWWHFLTVVGYWWFWWSFIRKVWSVDHTIIVIYINGVCYEGTLRGPCGPKNTEYLSLYNRCASRICTLWL